MGLLIGAFRSLRGDLKGEMKEMKEEMKEEMHAGETRVNKRIDEVKGEMKEVKGEMRAGEDRTNKRIDEVTEEMRAGEVRTNKRIDEVKEEMKEVKVEIKEFKQEMGEIKTLLIQALRLPTAGPALSRSQAPMDKACGQGAEEASSASADQFPQGTLTSRYDGLMLCQLLACLFPMHLLIASNSVLLPPPPPAALACCGRVGAGMTSNLEAED